MPKALSLSVQDAYKYLAKQVPSWRPPIETVAIDQAVGKILARQPVARVNAPPENNSAMDGFAVCAKDALLNKPFSISQRITAGASPKPLKEGTAARIFTGAVMPQGADTVVIQENCQFDNQTMTIISDFKSAAHVRHKGSDVNKGDRVLAVGQRMRPQDIGLLITVGISEVEVYRALRVAVIATGDELLNFNEKLTPGKIYESNSLVISAKLQQIGCDATRFKVKDTLAATEKVLTSAVQQCDAVITIGGVSVGEEDHVQAAIKNKGQVEFWKINMKPGKPFLFGKIGDTPVMGLPGNPVSAFVTFSLFCQPFLKALNGSPFVQPRRWQVAAGFESARLSDREDYLRGQLQVKGGKTSVIPVGKQLSSIQGSLCAADVLIVVPPESKIALGQLIEVISLQELAA